MQFENGNMTKWTGRVPPLDLSSVSVCPRETEHRWHQQTKTPSSASLSSTSSQSSSSSSTNCKLIYDLNIGNDGLPIDPRDWTRADVWKWLTDLALSEGLQPTTELAQKFRMNGKALCLMSLDMYLARVPIGGKMLYRDFRVRLGRAMSLQ